MIKRAGIMILAALAFLASVACTREPLHTGTVTLSFSTGEPATRVGDGVAGDGVGIYNGATTSPDLTILLVNSSGTVEARYPDGGTLSSSTVTEATVQFTGIPEGDYDVYAVANSRVTLTLDGLDLTTVTSKTDLDAAVFTALSDLTPPSVGDWMPLSATGSISVNASGNGHLDLELLRCVAKVEVIFKNLTGQDLSITDCDVTLDGLNPTTGYLFQPDGDDAAGTVRSLELAQDLDLTFDTKDNQKQSTGSLLVFPSIAPESPGYYACNVSFTVNSVAKSFTDLPVHDNKSKNIPSIGRNQYLKIEIRISNQADISFNFEVSDWTDKTETVEFS